MAVADQVISDDYALYNGDCVEVLSDLPDRSVGLSVYSPPFCGLYNYSSDDRDMSNSISYDAFYRHYNFLVEHIARVTKPGRCTAVHCMDIPVPGQRDGFHDLPGRLIEIHERHGFYFFGRFCIWKEPLAVAIRTRLKHLTHKQLVKDSCASTVAAGDFLLIFKKRGENAEPVAHPHGFTEYFGGTRVPEELFQYRGTEPQELNKFSQWVWRQYASCVWMDIRTSNDQRTGDGRTAKAILDYKAARDPEDEKHVHPLQLDVIHRAVNMWSNPGDIVLSPFMGVGSEVYGAVYNGRRGLGVELKGTYFKQAAKNISAARHDRATEVEAGTLFDVAAE